MRWLVCILGCVWGLAAQDLPSALSVTQAEADQALKDLKQNLVTKGAEGVVGARAKGLESLSNLSQKQAKARFGLTGANQGPQATAIKGELAKKASWLKTWKAVSGIVDYGAAIGEAGGYLAEGDARGAMGVVADTLGRKASGWIAGAGGAVLGGPLGAVAGAAAGESSWTLNPAKKWLQSTVNAGRDQAAADRQLGYRPTWRDHEAYEAKKRREAEKAKQDPVPGAGSDDEATRKMVEGRLISQNLPASEGLVSQLVGLIQSRGLDALEAALKECRAMQGTFEGTLAGKGTLRLTVEGLAVSGSFAHRAVASAGGMTATANTTGDFTGTFDPVAGTLAFKGTLKTIATGNHINPVPDLMPVAFTGHYTGQGFTGTAVANSQSLTWSAVR